MQVNTTLKSQFLSPSCGFILQVKIDGNVKGNDCAKSPLHPNKNIQNNCLCLFRLCICFLSAINISIRVLILSVAPGKIFSPYSIKISSGSASIPAVYS